MKNGTRGVETLQFVLNIQGIENIGGVTHWQMGTIGVIRSIVIRSGDNIWKFLLIVFCQAIGG